MTAPGLLSPAHHEMRRLLADRPDGYLSTATAWHRIASPIVLDADRLTAQVAAVRRLCVLVGRLPELVFADRARHRRHVGLPSELDDLLDDDGLAEDFFARPDCALSGGRLMALELNIGTGTVNISADFASRLYFATATPLQDALSALGDDWHVTEWDLSEALARVLRELADSGPVGLWYHDPTPDRRRRLAEMAEMLDVHGVRVVPVTTADVLDVDLPLFAYFSSLHLLGPDGPALCDRVRAVRRAGRHRMLVRPGDLARTSKANLPLLYGLAERGGLDPSDAELVLTHLPETVPLESATLPAIRAQQDDWVVKPATSYQATGVHIGRYLTRERWSDVLDSAGPGVAQRFMPPDPVPVLAGDGTGLTEVTGGRPVLMPHFLGGRFAGMSARFAPEDGVLGQIDFDRVFPTLCLAACRNGVT